MNKIISTLCLISVASQLVACADDQNTGSDGNSGYSRSPENPTAPDNSGSGVSQPMKKSPNPGTN